MKDHNSNLFTLLHGWLVVFDSDILEWYRVQSQAIRFSINQKPAVNMIWFNMSHVQNKINVVNTQDDEPCKAIESPQTITFKCTKDCKSLNKNDMRATGQEPYGSLSCKVCFVPGAAKLKPEGQGCMFVAVGLINASKTPRHSFNLHLLRPKYGPKSHGFLLLFRGLLGALDNRPYKVKEGFN